MLKSCEWPSGCPRLSEHRLCEVHRPQRRKDRPSAAERGYDARWYRRSRAWLALPEHRWCVLCLPRLIIATVVDHVIPHHGDEALFWDESNWQPLCKHHHDSKTRKEQPRKVRDPADEPLPAHLRPR